MQMYNKLTAFKLHSKNVKVLENKQLPKANSPHLDQQKNILERLETTRFQVFCFI